MDSKEIKRRFLACKDANERYSLLMEVGDSLPPFPENEKTDSARVQGCQSTTYIQISFVEGKVKISGTSEAKISKGLLALLIAAFSGETPQTILTTPFSLPQEIQLPELLSPSRSQGLLAMHLHLKKAVIPFLSRD